MRYKYLFCILEKEKRNNFKELLVNLGFKYNTDFKIKKDKSETFNFWILEDYNKEDILNKLMVTKKGLML